MSRRLLLGAVALALCGCYTIRYHRGGVTPQPGTPREQWHHGAVAGFFDLTGAIPVGEMCPDGVAWAESEVTLGDGLLQYLAAGAPGLRTSASKKKTTPAADFALGREFSLWTPSTVRVACARPRPLAGKRVKMALVRLTARAGVEQAVTDLFSDALAGELRKRPGLSVVSDADVAAVLGVERQKAMLGCSDAGCIAELGGALGVDRIVHGSVGRVGSSLVVNLSAVDPRRGTPVGAFSERLAAASDEAFLDALPRMVDGLLAEPTR